MPILRLSISGMSCQNCVGHARTALEAVAGVRSATVTLDPPQAVIEHDGADAEALLGALLSEDYAGTVVE